MLDKRILEYASRAGIEIVELETLEEHYDFGFGFSPKYYIAELKEAIATRGEREKRALRLYMRWDEKGMEKLLEEERKPDYLQKVIERNRRMASRSLPYLKNESVLVSTGIGHALGAENLLDQYRQEGIEVRRI